MFLKKNNKMIKYSQNKNKFQKTKKQSQAKNLQEDIQRTLSLTKKAGRTQS